MVVKILKAPKDGDYQEVEVLRSIADSNALLKGLPTLKDWGRIDKKSSKFLRVKQGSLFIVL